MKVASLPDLHTSHLYAQEITLVLISVVGRIKSIKNPNNPTEPMTLQLVGQCLIQMHCCVPPDLTHNL